MFYHFSDIEKEEPLVVETEVVHEHPPAKKFKESLVMKDINDEPPPAKKFKESLVMKEVVDEFALEDSQTSYDSDAPLKSPNRFVQFICLSLKA